MEIQSAKNTNNEKTNSGQKARGERKRVTAVIAVQTHDEG